MNNSNTNENTLNTFNSICSVAGELEINKIPFQIHFDDKGTVMLLVECLTSSDGFVKLLTSEYSVNVYVFNYLESKTLTEFSITKAVFNIESDFTTIEFESNRLAELAFNINNNENTENDYISLWLSAMNTCNDDFGTNSAVLCTELFTQFNEIFTKLNSDKNLEKIGLIIK